MNETLNDLTKRKDKIFEIFEDGIIGKDILKDRLEKLDADIGTTIKQLDQIKNELMKIPIEKVPYEMVKTVFQNFNSMIEKADPEDQKVLLHMMINKITVTDRRNIDTTEIHYNGQLKAFLELKEEGISSNDGDMPSFCFSMVK